jgi:NADH dehydrogenase (ubiquinone) 1 beta subcomplex subunit 9
MLNSHFFSLSVPKSPGGVAYAREVLSPDWVLDYWHPLEKAQYPEYFAKREQRKKEYLKFYEQHYGKPPVEHH